MRAVLSAVLVSRPKLGDHFGNLADYQGNAYLVKYKVHNVEKVNLDECL